MCPTCRGLGTRIAMDTALVVPEDRLSVMEGAIAPIGVPRNRWKIHYYEGVLKRHGASVHTPWKEIPEEGRQELLYGVFGKIRFEWRRSNGEVYRHRDTFEGILPPLERRYAEANTAFWKRKVGAFMHTGSCPDCRGARLRPEALAVKIEGRSLPEVMAMSVEDAYAFFAGLALTPTQETVAEDGLKEVTGRLTFLLDVGLDYLSLDRTAPTLSGGEAQRIRLAGQIGSGLVGVTYVLDEPSIGLHHRDNRRLLDALCSLRDAGNTVIVVEHDEETMRRADRVVDFGPGPGHLGGEGGGLGGLAAGGPRSRVDYRGLSVGEAGDPDPAAAEGEREVAEGAGREAEQFEERRREGPAAGAGLCDGRVGVGKEFPG